MGLYVSASICQHERVIIAFRRVMRSQFAKFTFTAPNPFLIPRPRCHGGIIRPVAGNKLSGLLRHPSRTKALMRPFDGASKQSILVNSRIRTLSG